MSRRKLEAVGDTVEPFHFILHPKDEQSLTRENQNKGKELYSLLVHHEIIQGDTIRKRFRNNSQERDKIEKIIRNDLDPSIAHPLITLLNSKSSFERKDFEDFVCYREELWKILNINRIEKELPRIYENVWKVLEDKIDPQQSGGLAKYKYGDIKRNIERILNKILKNIQFENDKDLILSKILSLQGDIRSFKTGLKANLKDFIDLQDQENVPSELRFFEGFNLNKFLIIEEDKSWWDWNAFAVAMIGLVQVIAEAVLVAFGLTQIGNALISGTFSWKEWAIQKAIGFGLSMLTVGIGKFLTDKIMEQIQENVIQKIVSKIEENLLKGIIGLINNKVETSLSSKMVLEKEIKYKLIPEAMKKLRNENDKLVVIMSHPFKAGTIKQTDNVRLDDQNFTGNSDYVNFQVQIGGQRYEHQRRGNESTTVAHVLVSRPPKDSDAVYHYSSRKIAKTLLDSLNNDKTVKLLAENL
ncbi:unnamed protein product [Rotaria sp. Silwood1]|nr:unnamed protein product [Rotaria sp. Silwood1]CAF1483186.1 unnamed protein product [Rotaria sp. Silwood1]